MRKCVFDTYLPVECGCEVASCAACGLKKAYRRCEAHRPVAYASRVRYLDEFAGHIDGVPQCRRASQEMQYFLNRVAGKAEELIRAPGQQGRALEIGSGIGLLIPFVLSLGYSSVCAIEDDAWARDYLASAYPDLVEVRKAREWQADTATYDLVLACHVLEHLARPDLVLSDLYRVLRRGRPALFIVPDDEDLCNPEHLWFFNRTNFSETLQEAGFRVIAIEERRLVERESFIYALCVK